MPFLKAGSEYIDMNDVSRVFFETRVGVFQATLFFKNVIQVTETGRVLTGNAAQTLQRWFESHSETVLE